MGTSNTRGSRRFVLSMVLSVDDSGRSCGSGKNVRALVVPRRIISAGQMLSLLPRGFSLYTKPMGEHANPDEETTDWRAVCGRTACTVRRAGRARALSDPYQWPLSEVEKCEVLDFTLLETEETTTLGCPWDCGQMAVGTRIYGSYFDPFRTQEDQHFGIPSGTAGWGMWGWTACRFRHTMAALVTLGRPTGSQRHMAD